MIQQREPLRPTARRAGWVGCNILVEGIPSSGRIFLIKNRTIEPEEQVLAQWRRTLFLREQNDLGTKGWLLDVMKCIERLRQATFTIEQIYSFESDLRVAYPKNRHIKEKIRQQLQTLRDKAYLDFVGNGVYRLKAEVEAAETVSVLPEEDTTE